ncbi:SHOCT domain-containing protein [Liquorilactobacillus sp.]|uniref:SHOCT domain-containing protein n=1 Tax=Liquorilactobacillus sp. TaxID=2767923 RepID=UPI0039E81F9B
MKVYDDVSQKSSDIAAQQKIANGVQKNGFGNAAGMMFGTNFTKGLGNKAEAGSMSLSEQIENVKKLKELQDAGILSQAEFEIKKKEIMGL